MATNKAQSTAITTDPTTMPTTTATPTLQEILSSMAAELAAVPEAPEAQKATRGVKRVGIPMDAQTAALAAMLGGLEPCVSPSGSAGWGKPAEAPKACPGAIGRAILAAGTPAKHGSLRLVLAILAAAQADGTFSLPTFPSKADGRQRWGLLATLIARKSGLRFVLRRDGTCYLTALRTAGSTDDDSPTDG